MKPAHILAKLLGVLALIFGGFLGGWAIARGWGLSGALGLVKSPTPWIKDPAGDPTKIHVWRGATAGWLPVNLPVGITAAAVRAVEIGPMSKSSAVVEVKHAATDRLSVATSGG